MSTATPTRQLQRADLQRLLVLSARTARDLAHRAGLELDTWKDYVEFTASQDDAVERLDRAVEAAGFRLEDDLPEVLHGR
jgi:hypothetical protein